MNNTCIHAQAGKFREHIKQEHNMWNYVFFIAHIKDKPTDELTGVEADV